MILLFRFGGVYQSQVARDLCHQDLQKLLLKEMTNMVSVSTLTAQQQVQKNKFLYRDKQFSFVHYRIIQLLDNIIGTNSSLLCSTGLLNF